MKTLKPILITAVIIFLTTLLPAQQVVSADLVSPEFMKVNRAYANAEKLQMNINYSLYADYTTGTKLQDENGVYMKQGNSIYSELFGIVSLSNTKASVTIDQTEKVIVVSDPASHKIKSPGEPDLDTLLSLCSRIEYTEKENGTRLYRLQFDKTPYSQYATVDICLNSKTFFLEKIVLYFRDEAGLNPSDPKIKSKPRLEITYSSIETNPVFEKNQFSETRFISISGKKITCAPAFSTFHLINNKLS